MRTSMIGVAALVFVAVCPCANGSDWSGHRSGGMSEKMQVELNAGGSQPLARVPRDEVGHSRALVVEAGSFAEAQRSEVSTEAVRLHATEHQEVADVLLRRGEGDPGWMAKFGDTVAAAWRSMTAGNPLNGEDVFVISAMRDQDGVKVYRAASAADRSKSDAFTLTYKVGATHEQEVLADLKAGGIAGIEYYHFPHLIFHCAPKSDADPSCADPPHPEEEGIGMLFPALPNPADLSTWLSRADDERKKDCVDEITERLTEVVAAVHKHGWVHGNINAQNIVPRMGSSKCPRVYLSQFDNAAKATQEGINTDMDAVSTVLRLFQTA